MNISHSAIYYVLAIESELLRIHLGVLSSMSRWPEQMDRLQVAAMGD